MQEADYKTTYDETITNTRYTLANARKTTQEEIPQGEDHTIPRGRENYDHTKGRGEQLEQHKGSPIGTSKERNIKLRSLEHDTLLPHAKTSFILFKSSTPTTTNEQEQCIQPTERQAPPPRPRHRMLP